MFLKAPRDGLPQGCIISKIHLLDAKQGPDALLGVS